VSHVLHIIEVAAIVWIACSISFALGAFWAAAPR